MTTYLIQIDQQQRNFIIEGLILLIAQRKHLPTEAKADLIDLTQMMSTQIEPSPMMNGLCL